MSLARLILFVLQSCLRQDGSVIFRRLDIVLNLGGMRLHYSSMSIRRDDADY